MTTDLLTFVRFLVSCVDFLFAGVMIFGVIMGTFADQGRWVVILIIVTLVASGLLIIFK